ncbi:bifunctional TENA-E protein isoform X2 [Cucurbita pepo subsp. pepo]|uniref:bifunctional TENA-E protein isoform X2 n=1 Tax=Cucurbita pepo subsp. pepo TaxID=3664 RepID=UPI000C9D87F4|nr:bifunctional TENA-E protein isoform X2 [Cucurbita pepo subsp. pepo]
MADPKTRAQLAGGMTATDSWIRKHRLIYTDATRHPLVLSIRDGTVDLNAFRTWVEQECEFLRSFTAFVASVLVKAWKESDDRADEEVILGSLASLNDEFAWFKKEALKRDIDLTKIVPQNATAGYSRFLESLMRPEMEYTVAITALWAIEAVYHESFAYCMEDGSKTPLELREACERWGNEGFGNYCNTLKKIVDRRLEMAAGEISKKTEVALLRVLECEVAFWNMSRDGPRQTI